MNAQPQASQSVPASPTAPQPLRRPLDPKELIAALTAIRRDSQCEPEGYLRDTVVPHGGE
jgi:hypothetical protein